MATTTYSFSDVHMVLNFPGYPGYTVNGQGVGEISIAYINDNTVHELSADGSVMVSKIKADNANVTITMQQTSPMHQWMNGMFNYIQSQPTSYWAAGTISVTALDGGVDNIDLSGVSFTKRADQPFQQQGQMVTWNLMAANGVAAGSTKASIQQAPILNTQANLV